MPLVVLLLQEQAINADSPFSFISACVSDSLY